MLWTPFNVSAWFFPPDSTPDSLVSATNTTDASPPSPDLSEFGTPAAFFAGPDTCDFPGKFFNHSIVFDTTFCGGWAGGEYSNSNCPLVPGQSSIQSCEAFVGGNPDAFTEAYWAIRSLRVWEMIFDEDEAWSSDDDGWSSGMSDDEQSNETSSEREVKSSGNSRGNENDEGQGVAWARHHADLRDEV